MAQVGNVILGRFDEPVRMCKAPPAHTMAEEFCETDPQRDFARGFAIQTVGPLPIAFGKQMMGARGSWGWGPRRIMDGSRTGAGGHKLRESDGPVVIQHTRLDSRKAENALLSQIAFPGGG